MSHSSETAGQSRSIGEGWIWMILGALIWCPLSYLLVVRTGSVIVDGFQSIGSAAATAQVALSWLVHGL